MLFGIVIDCLLFVFLALYMAFADPEEDELNGKLYINDTPEAVVVAEIHDNPRAESQEDAKEKTPDDVTEIRQEEAEQETQEEADKTEPEKKTYIKWVDFQVTCEALNRAYQYDIDTYGKEVHLDWIVLLAYAGAKKGGTFDRESLELMDELAEKLRSKEITLEQATGDLKYYPYYYEAYMAVLGGMVGEYRIQMLEEEENKQEEKSGEAKRGEGSMDENNTAWSESSRHWEHRYGLKAFHPIAKGFSYSDYDDFGVSRSYGYKRVHLGHDMMGLIGTPIVAVESGVIEAIGWNQYGGWRIGIRSFDEKRYYYYAHLRQNWPWVKTLQEGDTVQAGDIIGYMGHTGYSKTENVNNIEQVHLHFGIQLIFDESQKEGTNQIWISCYELVKFLCRNRSEAVKDGESGEWVRIVKTE